MPILGLDRITFGSRRAVLKLPLKSNQNDRNALKSNVFRKNSERTESNTFNPISHGIRKVLSAD